MDYVGNMPVIHPLENMLRLFFKQEKHKYEQVHGSMDRKRVSVKRSSSTSSTKNKSNKKSKTSSSNSKKRKTNTENTDNIKRRKMNSRSKLSIGTTLRVRVMEGDVPMVYQAVVKEKTKVWNQVKVEYVGFDGLFDLDVLEDEILEN